MENKELLEEVSTALAKYFSDVYEINTKYTKQLYDLLKEKHPEAFNEDIPKEYKWKIKNT